MSCSVASSRVISRMWPSFVLVRERAPMAERRASRGRAPRGRSREVERRAAGDGRVCAWRSARRRGSSQKTSRRSRGSFDAVSSSIASAWSVSRRRERHVPCDDEEPRARVERRHAHSRCAPCALRAGERPVERGAGRGLVAREAIAIVPRDDLRERLVLAEAAVLHLLP